MQNAVGVDVERDFDLRQSARRRRNSFEVEFTEKLIGTGHLVFALEDLNRHRRLIVFSRREDLRVLRRNRGVALNHRRHNAAQGFNTKGQRRHVEQEHVVTVARQHGALNRGTDGHGLIGVHILTRFLAEEFTHHFLHAGHTGLTAHENHVGDVGDGSLRVRKRLLHRFNRALHQVFDEAFKLRTRDRDVHVLRARGVRGNVREVHFRFLAARKFDLRLFRGVLQALQGEHVLREVAPRILLELVHQVLHQTMVEVFAAQERIAVRRQHFKLLVAVHVRDINHRNIERAAAQVVHRDLAIGSPRLVQTEGQRRSRRFVDDALHFETGDAARVLRRLTLAVVKIRRHRNHGFRHRFTEIVFRSLLHLAEHFRGNLLRRQLLVAQHLHPSVAVVSLHNGKRRTGDVLLHFSVFITTADQTLHGKERVLRVRNGLALSRSTDDDFAVFKISHD